MRAAHPRRLQQPSQLPVYARPGRWFPRSVWYASRFVARPRPPAAQPTPMQYRDPKPIQAANRGGSTLSLAPAPTLQNDRPVARQRFIDDLFVNPYCIWPGRAGRAGANPRAHGIWTAGLTVKKRIGKAPGLTSPVPRALPRAAAGRSIDKSPREAPAKDQPRVRCRRLVEWDRR
jgi:hypothetical protein